jgi:hypothetical protein
MTAPRDRVPPPPDHAPSLPASSQSPDGIDVHLVSEEVRGPILGLYIAAYTVFTSRGFFSYAKVTWLEPRSYWEAHDVLFKLAFGPRASGSESHEGVFRAAEARLGRRTAFQPTHPAEP